ncbi:hypothetical protein OPV22_029640 [Ensete ventricosum]|uniref:U1-type domain-containing protein n=1 Tax=Ensete ventricosum TaxID=4639 RepID=A0AAV8QBR7_ENSVE|nr:hypothetical protein OPV22_029640 [Ensete ventricosum]
MVWFQCEDCGENLKKPKLPNHFRICSAYKLSCIDCGKTFDQESVQRHTQCISEAEKYGPKDQGKASQKAQEKPDKPKPNADVDVNVGLSSRPPWFCSLCNTNTTSKQTLLLHADGKKHRAKARAFHAAQKQSTQTVEPTSNTEIADGKPPAKSIESNGFPKTDESKDELNEAVKLVAKVENESSAKRKRNNEVIEDFAKDNEKNVHDLSNGEVIQAREIGTEGRPNKKKHVEDHHDKQYHGKEFSQHKVKWKKLVTSTLKTNPDLTMKIKKLQKIVIKMVKESGVTEDEAQLREMLMDKINSSSRFMVNNKKIQLVTKAEDC